MNTPVQPTKHQAQLPPIAWWSIISLFSLAIGWYLVLGVGVYGGWWQGPRTMTVLRWTPLPAALVNWRPLSYADYLNQRTAVNKYTAYLQITSAGVYPGQSTTEAVTVTLTKMVRIAVSEQLIKRLGVTLTSADVKQAYQSQLLQNGNPGQVADTIKQLYGWTPAEFQRHVIRPAVLRDKLQAKLSFDETISAAAKTQAKKVLTLVQATPDNFGELAKKYSDDVYGANGGDLGFVNQGEQVKEIDDAAFNLELNQISDLIHTEYGYHILKVTARKTVDGREQAHLFQITILAPQIDQYVSDQIKKMKVWVLVPRMNWDAGQSRITETAIKSAGVNANK